MEIDNNIEWSFPSEIGQRALKEKNTDIFQEGNDKAHLGITYIILLAWYPAIGNLYASKLQRL